MKGKEEEGKRRKTKRKDRQRRRTGKGKEQFHKQMTMHPSDPAKKNLVDFSDTVAFLPNAQVPQVLVSVLLLLHLLVLLLLLLLLTTFSLSDTPL